MNYIETGELKFFLDNNFQKYNNKQFIETDPIQIPHSFAHKEDIEIAAFLSSSIAWGKRSMIINNAKRMMNLLENKPFDFIRNASDKEIFSISKFVHRTFNVEDFRYFLISLRNIYTKHKGLENVFNQGFTISNTIEDSLIHFRKVFFEIQATARTYRHISNVEKNSAAKRLNMFLMWMIRKDAQGVHFGLWNKIPTSALKIPLDVHVANCSRKLKLLQRKQNDWKAVCELTANLAKFDSQDPVKYDFALFGLGIEKFCS